MGPLIQQIIQTLLDVFRFHKKKIAFFAASTVFCALIIFPFDDLSDFVSLQVTKNTQGNVYLQFDGLSFGFMPGFGIKMEDVVVESVFAPTLSVKTLGFAPKIFSLLTGNPGGRIKAYGLFKGDATVDFSPSKQLKVDNEMGVAVNLSEVNLKDLSKLLKSAQKIPVVMDGKTNFSSQVYVDPSFKAQPKGVFDLNIKKLKVPPFSLPLTMNGVAFGSWPIPGFKISDIKAKGNISDGKLFIKEGKIGDVKDDLHGTVTGDILYDLQPGGKFQMAGYDLKINLTLDDALKNQLSTTLGFLDGFQNIGDRYKFDTLQGVRYSLRITAADLRRPPRVTGN